MENCNNTSSPVANGDKHSDQLIIKAQLGDDIRKLMINNEDLTLNGELLLFPDFFLSIFVFRTRSHDGTYICWQNLEFR